jgi:MYXO-CTERM domain-containing protein
MHEESEIMKSVALGSVCALFVSASASAAFVGGGIVSLDSWNTAANATVLPGAAGGAVTVYRVYALFDGQSSTNDQMNSVFGANITSSLSVVNISGAFPTGDIFENAAVQWDSMATINVRTTTGDSGMAPAADGDGINWGANSLTGGWFVAGSSQGLAGTKAGAEAGIGVPGGLFAVMIAQFTVLQADTAGDIKLWNTNGTINGGTLLSGSLGLGVNNQSDPSIGGIQIVPVPTPGALALCGLAGLTALRRRRTA